MEPIYVVPKEREPNKNYSDIIILEAVDESLSSFGELVKETVYSQLQKNYRVERYEIPLKAEALASTMEELFGDSARFVEIRIMEKLYAKAKGFLHIPKDENLTFKDYLQSIRCFLDNPLTI